MIAFIVFQMVLLTNLGGESGFKYKSKRIKELLLANTDKPMSEQKDYLEKTFNNWKGSYEQVDDVLLMGLRI